MFQRRPDCPFLLRWASGNLGVIGLRLIITVPNLQPTFSLDLGDIEAGHLQPEFLQHIGFDLIIGSLALDGGQVKFIKAESVEQKYFLLHCDSTLQNLLNRIIKHRIYIFRLRLPQPL